MTGTQGCSSGGKPTPFVIVTAMRMNDGSRKKSDRASKLSSFRSIADACNGASGLPAIIARTAPIFSVASDNKRNAGQRRGRFKRARLASVCYAHCNQSIRGWILPRPGVWSFRREMRPRPRVPQGAYRSRRWLPSTCGLPGPKAHTPQSTVRIRAPRRRPSEPLLGPRYRQVDEARRVEAARQIAVDRGLEQVRRQESQRKRHPDRALTFALAI
jgi:hypothetical protein